MTLPRAVLFDLDGVLVSSKEAWFESVRVAGQRFGGVEVDRARFDDTFGQGTQADIDVFGLSCTEAELARLYVEVFPRFASSIWVDPEAAPLLSRLRSRGRKTAVVTNTTQPLAGRILRSAGLAHLLDAVACASDVPKAKPAPDVVHFALRQLGVGAREAAMVGDSRFDREAARAAGVRFVGLRIDGDARLEELEGVLGVA